MSDSNENAAAPAGEGSTDQATGFADERLLVSGSIADAVSTVSALTLDLIVGTGTAGKQRYMVPYVDIEINGELLGLLRAEPEDRSTDDPTKAADESAETADEERPFAPHTGSIVLSFDNVAFMLERSANRYRKLVKTLSQMVTDEIGPMPGRVEYAANALNAASVELAKAAATLKSMLPESGRNPGRAVLDEERPSTAGGSA